MKMPGELRGHVETACARASEMDTFRNDERYCTGAPTYRPDPKNPPPEKTVEATIGILRKSLGLTPH